MSHYYNTNTYQTIRNRFFSLFVIPLAYRIMSRYTIHNSLDSVQYILDKKCSVCRFGDGEFSVIRGDGNGFQSPNQILSKRLKEILLSDFDDRIVLGIPIALKDISYLIDGYPPFFWRFYVGKHFLSLIPLLDKKKTYINASFTRFYYEVKDKSQCGEQIGLIRQIWQDRDIVIVEGCQTRSGVGNDLYDNARSIQRVLGPATNAFDKYDEILSSIEKNVSRDTLILLSLGMTATVLAYDLSKRGYQAIDLGHLDIEYEWFRQGLVMDKPIPVQGKFTNEAEGGNEVSECCDPLYQSQIICKIV